MKSLTPTLRRLEGKAGRLILPTLITLDDARIAEAVDRVLAPTTDAAMVAGLTAYDLDRENAAVDGRYQAYMPDPQPINAEGLVGWARGAALTEASFRALILAGMGKRIAMAARRSIIENAAADPAADGWQRRAVPGACYFCRMLAGRGAVYRGEDTATFAAHTTCRCEAVPAWSGRSRPVRAYTPSARESTPADRERVRKWIADNRARLDA